VSGDERILLDAGSSGRGWSWRSNLLRCVHRFALIEAGYTGDDRDALLRGSLFHVGGAHYYARRQAKQLGADPDDYYDPLEAMERACIVEPARRPFLPICEQALEAYERKWAHDGHEILAVEHLVAMDIVGPTTGKVYKHTARIDLITRQHGKVWVWDHKTHGAPANSRKRTGFELSGQVIGLSWWARQTYGLDFAGFIINLVRLDTKEIKMERFKPKIAPYAQGMFPAVIEHSEEYLIWCRDRYGDDPDNWPPILQEQGPCMDRYGACEFRSMCRWGKGFGGQDG
jgi:hypothetical protein